MQAVFSAATNASLFFQGGITAYNIGQKCRHLNGELVHAQNNNGITAKVASQMATEANRLFLSHYGIGVTGYATAVPEQGINELFAFYTFAEGSEVLVSNKIFSNKNDSVEAQRDFCFQILRKFREMLLEKEAGKTAATAR